MNRELGDYLSVGSEPAAGRNDNGIDSKVLDQLPLCERIAFERAVKKGLAELRTLNPDMAEFDTLSLYNYPAAEFGK